MDPLLAEFLENDSTDGESFEEGAGDMDSPSSLDGFSPFEPKPEQEALSPQEYDIPLEEEPFWHQLNKIRE